MDKLEKKWPKLDNKEKLDKMDKIGQNWKKWTKMYKWTKLDKMDKIGQKRQNGQKLDKNG